MNASIILAGIAVGAVAATAVAVGATAESARAPVSSDHPNIVFLLADDLGYGDLGIQGDKQAVTPNIDALAAHGVRLTDYYANHPICAPSRAALLTGIYQHRMGFEYNPGSPKNTPPIFGLPPSATTMAQRLKAVGYATAMFGKWHVGFQPDRIPTAKGFDVFYGFLSGAHSYTPQPPRGRKGGTEAGADRWGGGGAMLRGTTPEPMPAHTTEAFGREAANFIDQNKQRQFFVYLPFNAVHAPLDTTKAYYNRFPEIKDEKRRVHLAQLAAIDDAIGQVVATLRKDGLLEKTIVVFASDNGGPTQQTTSSNAPLNGVKGLVLEGGIRVPAIVAWPGHLPQNKVIKTMAMSFDLTATILNVTGTMPASGLDGVDLMPYLSGAKTGDAHKALFWRMGGQGAVRDGQWKLVRNDETLHLFDLSADIGEHSDLARTQPERVKALNAEWQAWSTQMQKPLWIRNQLSGGDSASGRRLHEGIEAMIRGEKVDVPDSE